MWRTLDFSLTCRSWWITICMSIWESEYSSLAKNLFFGNQYTYYLNSCSNSDKDDNSNVILRNNITDGVLLICAYELWSVLKDLRIWAMLLHSQRAVIQCASIYYCYPSLRLTVRGDVVDLITNAYCKVFKNSKYEAHYENEVRIYLELFWVTFIASKVASRTEINI